MDVTDAEAVRAELDLERPDMVVNCAAWTDVDGAETAEDGAFAVNGTGAGNVAAAAREVGAAVVFVSTDYVFDGEKGAPYVESDQPAPLSAYGRTKLAGEEATAAANKRHFIVRSARPLRDRRRATSSPRCCGSPKSTNEVLVVRDQVTSPTYTWHLAYGLTRLIDGIEYGIHHMAAAGHCSWYEFAREIFEQAKVDCKVLSDTTEMLGRPRRRARLSRRCRASASTRSGCPPGTMGWPGTSPNARPRRTKCLERGRNEMKLLVTGAAGFIGSTYVRIAGDEHDIVVLDKLTYAGRPENLPEGTQLIEGAIEDPAIVREAMQGVDAVVNFAAESHVDRSIDDQDAFARTHVIGTGTLLDAARELGIQRYVQVSTDEVYGSIDSGSFTETSPLDPSSPYSATKAAGDLLVGAHVAHLRARRLDRPRLQQLRPAPVPGEADPADGAERAPRRLAAGLRRRQAGPQLALRRGLLPRHPHRARQRQGGRGLQRRRPRRVREHRGGEARDRRWSTATSR